MRWLMYQQENKRFPFHLLVEHEPRKFLSYAVQDKWPGPGKNIFCIAGQEITEEQLPEELEPVDSCQIKKIARYGRKLVVVLDRKIKKRSWFLTIEKKSKSNPGKTYQQTFWITQSSAMAHRGGAYLSEAGKRRDLTIVRDKRERYGYNFPKYKLEKEILPSGDYALKLSSGEVIAVVERKTKDGFIHEIATFDVLKTRLLEMIAAYKYCALLIEANYADLVDPKKCKFYSAGFVAEIIAELFANFPKLQIVFCSNRKFATEWIERYFQRISKIEEPKLINETTRFSQER
jgi:hypothetical protein